MSENLNINQMKQLQEVLLNRLYEVEEELEPIDNLDYMKKYLSAKKIEGCTERTIKAYKSTLLNLFKIIEVPVRSITTESIRDYLVNYQGINNCSKVTVDNLRRNLSSFFSWLEEENYIVKNPIRRIHKVKVGKKVRKVISDENIEIMRDYCQNTRDIAIIDLLYSTGMRIGELVNLDISDINFGERECIVYGKGDKERRVYFDAKTKLHLSKYIKERVDLNTALFVSLNKPYKRLNINGAEIRLRELGKKLGIEKVYPHKFRRTMATRAIDKGMPIEQVQQLLGHQQIDTTLRYAMVNQTNVKNSHKKYIG
jgi:integrase/recombinase XerD